MRWIVLLTACVVPGLSLFGCSSDGVTPTCSEASLYQNRYTDEDRKNYKPGQPVNPKNPSQPTLNGDCATLPGDGGISSSGGSGNTGSGGTGTGGTTGGTGGTN
ncbi:MAG: hypothetical protein AB7K71_30355 [Polyangiaceae bacterium]